MFNQDEIELYYSRTPRGVAATTMRNLERSTHFKEALDTEIGRLLFDDLILLLDEKFNLIVDGKETEQDKAIFKACQIIGDRWNKILKKYIASCNKIKQKIG
jgi:hypothetical protein